MWQRRQSYRHLHRLVRYITRCYSKGYDKPHVCVVGSGPAGFYTTQHLLKGNPNVHVDVYEKLPVPFGLVRYGVAPDHPEVKNVINTFTQTAGNSRCSFIGNVTIGQDISITELLQNYTAVILSYGADDDRMFGIPGEEYNMGEYLARKVGLFSQSLSNVISARNFVGWYNGLPQDKDLALDLDTDTAVILGQGNVALDVARVLLTPLDILSKTDITEHSLEALRQSRVKRVILVGRRGPLQVAFTIKELREMIKLPGTRPVLHDKDYEGLEDIAKNLARPRKRLTELLYKTALSPTETDHKLWGMANREWELRFRLSPLEILGDGSKVTGVRFGVNKLEGDNFATRRAVMTDDREDISCGLVLRSIGYKSISIDQSIPFDLQKGIVKNTNGKVDGINGLYCSGWVGRGPVGVILNTMADGFEVAKCVNKDMESGTLKIKSDRNTVLQLLQERGVKTVSFDDWKKIDLVEEANGEPKGKPREKIVNVSQMMDIVEQS